MDIPMLNLQTPIFLPLAFYQDDSNTYYIAKSPLQEGLSLFKNYTFLNIYPISHNQSPKIALNQQYLAILDQGLLKIVSLANNTDIQVQISTKGVRQIYLDQHYLILVSTNQLQLCDLSDTSVTKVQFPMTIYSTITNISTLKHCKIIAAVCTQSFIYLNYLNRKLACWKTKQNYIHQIKLKDNLIMVLGFNSNINIYNIQTRRLIRKIHLSKLRQKVRFFQQYIILLDNPIVIYKLEDATIQLVLQNDIICIDDTLMKVTSDSIFPMVTMITNINALIPYL